MFKHLVPRCLASSLYYFAISKIPATRLDIEKKNTYCFNLNLKLFCYGPDSDLYVCLWSFVLNQMPHSNAFGKGNSESTCLKVQLVFEVLVSLVHP